MLSDNRAFIKDDTLNNERDRVGSFAYYRLNGMPIRMVYSKEGNLIGSNSLDIESSALVIGSYIKTVDTDPMVEEITESEFYEMCHQLIAEYRSSK